MEDEIIRDDFPSVRKGWDPDAVLAHLADVADAVPEESVAPSEPSLGDVAADRVRNVLAAAEQTAGEVHDSAQADADAKLRAADEESERIVTDARAEAASVLEGARADADAHTSAAKEAVTALVAEAEELRAKVASLSERISGSAPVLAGPDAEVPGPVTIPEPTPPTIPEPSPDPVPEPTPDPVPEPSPEPIPEPTPDPTPPGPDPDLPDDPSPEPPVPEPAPSPPAGRTTEDLIAQLKAGSAGTGGNGTAVAPPAAVSGSDLGAARLVAMNMALDGSTKEQIAAQLGSEFGDVPELDGLLDEVLSRAQG